MITPQDIQTKEFSKGVRGYKEDEVDIFLDALTIDYENLINENIALKAQIEELTTKVNEYRSQEGAVVKTLEAAKSLMSDISASAEKRADILIKNAEIDAAALVREAKDRLVSLQNEEKQITDRIVAYKRKFKAMLETELKAMGEEIPEKKQDADPIAVKQFNDLINSVPAKQEKNEKEFFESSEFKGFSDFDATIISNRGDNE